MPPTVQTNARDGRDRRGRAKDDKKTDLVCRVKFNNTLPDIPFDPKFIVYPFESNRFVQYNPTSLERTYKHELLTEHDLGVTIDLINPETYKDEMNYLDPEDEKLLEEDVVVPQDAKRSRHHNKNVSWLRKTEYISTEYNRFTQKDNKAEARVGFNIKKYFKEEDIYKDRESQLQAIERTFEAAKSSITEHYSKPGVVPLEVLPLYPDFELWRHPCAQVIFDFDPAPAGRSQPVQVEEMSQAIIRGMQDEQGDQFVAYFLPTEETLGKRKRDAELSQEYQDDDEYDYLLAREYNWNVKNKSSKAYEESYFFAMRPEGVFYNELETRVRLNKRRKLGTATAPTTNSRLIVKHRPLNETEISAQEARMTMLEPPGEEEEEEEEEFNFGAELKNSGEEDNAESGEEEKSDKEEEEDTAKENNGVPSERSRSRSKSPRSASGSPRRDDASKSPAARSRSASPAGSAKSGGSPRNRRASSSSSSSSSGSSSGSDSESDVEAKNKKKDEEEIFGSASSDDDD